MPGGSRQLFDPESPPLVGVPDPASFDPELHRDTHPDVLSVGALYNEVETALTRSFPRNRRLWVRGEIAKLSDHSSGHLYMDLVDPDEVRAAGSRGRGGVPTLGVKCWRTSWAPLRHSLEKEGIELAEGMIVVLRGTLDLYRAKGEVSFVLAEIDVTALLGRIAAQRAQLLRALEAEGLLRRNAALPVPEPALHVGLVASPGTEGYHDFVGRLVESGFGFRISLVKVPVQGPAAPTSIARGLRFLSRSDCDVIVSSAEAARRRIWPRSTPSSWPEPWRVRPSRCSPGSAIPATRAWRTSWRAARASRPTECGQQIALAVRQWWESPRPPAVGRPGAADPGLPRRRAGAATVRREVVSPAAARHQLRVHRDRVG